jgi:hypothetical protein
MVEVQYGNIATTASGLNLQNGPLAISHYSSVLGIRLSPLVVHV